MRIDAIDTLVCDAYRTNWVFVKVTTDSGQVGWGEATLECKEHAVCGAIEDLARAIVGRRASNIQGIWHDAYRDGYWRGGPVLMSALAGVEIALWDLKGKALGVPVYELLGGRMRDRVTCYANAWFAGATSPDEFAEKARQTVNAGFHALKWDPFGSAYRTIDRRTLTDALRCIEAVHEAVGDRAELLIEGHGRFDVPAAMRIARALEPFDVLWFEEPLAPDSLEALAELRRCVRVPIAAGERVHSRWDYARFFSLGCADYAQPDVTHVGGIVELKHIAAMAEAHRIAICPHNPAGPVANAAALQLAACIPNFQNLETMATDVPWRGEVCTEHAQFSDGAMIIPDTPGLGVEVNEAAVAEHPFQPHDLRHYRGGLTDIRPADAQSHLDRPNSSTP